MSGGPATAPSPARARVTYPDAETHRRRWRQLARAIAARAAEISDEPDAIAAPARPGSLEILGSGIEAVGFTRADEARIREADDVFYCVADPATKVWLLDQRPDAYDLYVLYDDSKRRYVTYMQMAEAMLHPVRQGRRVVAIFYGHPGIFVLASHRSVKIARREGHRAEMRSAVSALDTLCSDLGVDPSQPGMQMYEATDLLIRRRRPDTGLHLVLWQVGLIGELGYRRQGYLNRNFSVLLDYLEDLYGPDHEVVNYVGSRYPGIDPVMDRQTIASLRDPAVQNWVTGISTFYLPPKDAAASDPEMLARLGLIRPGQEVKPAVDPLRVIDRYGPRERLAFSDFAKFDVPQSYQWQPDTAAARFVLALCEDVGLRERYREDPAGTLKAWGGGLTQRERELLRKRDPGSIQIAAKGFRTAGEPENRRLLGMVLGRKSASAALLAAVRNAARGRAHAAAEDWATSQGLKAEWRSLAGDVQQLLRRALAPWTGLYLIAGQRRSLSIHGRPGSASVRVDLDGRRLAGLRFDKGVLRWSAEAGNGCSGYLQPDVAPSGARRWVGLIWPEGETPGTRAGHKVAAREHAPRPRLALSAIAGEYEVRAGDGPMRHVSVLPGRGGMTVALDGDPIDDPVAIAADGFRIGDLVVPIAARRIRPWLDPWLQGECRLRVQHGTLAEVVPLEISADGVAIGGRAVAARREGDDIVWTGGECAWAEGRLAVGLDPVTLRPLLHGRARSAVGAAAALRGMALIGEAEAASLSDTPRLGLPDWAWRHLVAIMAGASAKGGLFLWDGYDRASTNLMRLQQVLERLHRDEVD
jgi:hypothetical protein